MKIAVDTNILLDILLPDLKHVEQSVSLLTSYGKRGQLIISEIVCGELASQFTKEEVLVKFMSDTGINLVCSSSKALWQAAWAWKNYTKNRNREFQCKNCGSRQQLSCEKCNTEIVSRQHILPDFIIGGHALVHAGTLLTRDRGYYHSYFPELKLP